MKENRTIDTLADVLGVIDQAGLTGTRRRDMVSAINRICEMAGATPASVRAEPAVLKDMLSRIRPAAHGVSAKSYSNLKSLFAAALQLAGVIDPSGRGSAKTSPGLGTAAGSGRGRPAPVERARRLRELVRRSGHLAGRGGRHGRSTIPDLAGGQDAAPEATRSRARRSQILERGQRQV